MRMWTRRWWWMGLLGGLPACMEMGGTKSDGADSGAFFGGGGSDGFETCAVVRDWAEDCTLSTAQVEAEQRACEELEAELLGRCAADAFDTWTAARDRLYACYAAAGVCPDTREDPGIGDAAAACDATFVADVSAVDEVCWPRAGGGVEPEAACTDAEVLATHEAPAVQEYGLSLGDEGVASIDLPFEFAWFGEPLSSITVTANGLLRTGSGEDAGCCEGREIPTADAVDGMVAMAWTDLDPSAGGSVSWGVTGDDGDRIVRVSFVEVPTWSGDGWVTAQAELEEATGAVTVHLGALISPSQAVTVGLESNDAGHGVCVADIQATSGRWTGRSVRMVPEVTP